MIDGQQTTGIDLADAAVLAAKVGALADLFSYVRPDSCCAGGRLLSQAAMEGGDLVAEPVVFFRKRLNPLGRRLKLLQD